MSGGGGEGELIRGKGGDEKSTEHQQIRAVFNAINVSVLC
jgi:hypothetical protein